jgi:acetyltransferase-like isoleucine patch superfamily enzyme
LSYDRFKDWRHPIIEDRKLHPKYYFLVHYKNNLKLGNKTDIGAFTYINAKYGVVIENYVQIGSHCSIYSISTIDNKKGPVLIKENAKLGTHSTIMPDVTIGKNSIIGAYSYVDKNIPDDVMAFGAPVKIIGKTRE